MNDKAFWPPGSRGFTLTAIAWVLTFTSAATAAAEETPEQRLVISVEKIWDRAEHSAFTDLVAKDGQLYCAFREGTGHVPGLNGVIRVIRRRDDGAWKSVALLDEKHADLRDAKLSITPDGRLMVNMGASFYHGKVRLGIESRVAFSGSSFAEIGPPEKVIFPENMITGVDWLWRVTWHGDVAWGCVSQIDGKNRSLKLVRSSDAIHYEPVATLEVEGANETTLRFLRDETMVAMIRSEGNPPDGRIGVARPPYTDWKFVTTNKRFGGPNFIQLPQGAWLAASRGHRAEGTRTELWQLDLEGGKFRDLLTLPSSGDTSYAGLVVDEKNGRLYVSYYSGHDSKPSIYLATLRLDALEEDMAK